MSAVAYVGKYIDSGSRNSFYHIVGTKKYGFKEFQDESFALWSYNVQKSMSVYNVTPRVLGEVGRIRLNNGTLSDWGYLTELATKVKYCKDNNCGCTRWDYNDDCPNIKRMDEINDILGEHGLTFNDGHILNYGMVTRDSQKVMVIIDCGVEGFAYDEEIWGYVSPDGYGDNYGYGGCSCSECRRLS